MVETEGMNQSQIAASDPVLETRPYPAPVRGVRRVIYVLLALVFLGIGLVGVLLPGLPTTPFLLLMSYFLIQSWPWLHDRVVSMPLVGRPIREWRENRGVRKPIKVFASLMVLGVVTVTLLSSSIGWPIKAATVGLAGCGLIVVWRLPTIRYEESA